MSTLRVSKSPLVITAVQLGLLLFAVYYAFIGGQSAQGIYDDSWRRITLLLTSGIIGLWLLWKVLKSGSVPRTPLDWPLAMLLPAGLLATLFSDNPIYSRETLVFWITYLFFYTIAADLGRRLWFRELALNAIIAISAFVLAFAALQLSWWAADATVPVLLVPVLGSIAPLPRLSVLGNANVMASLLALIAPLLLYKVSRSHTRLAQILLGLWFGLLVIGILLTRSRGGLLALLIGVSFFSAIWFFARQTREQAAAWLHRHKWRLAGGGLLVLVGFIGLLTTLRGFTEGVSVRQHVMAGALQSWLQQPLFGVGPGVLGQALMQYWQPGIEIWPDAHNLYLTVIAETGLLGAIALAWLLVAAGKLLWATLRYTPGPQWDVGGLACAAALAGFATHNLVDSLLKTPLLMLLVAILAGFWMSSTLPHPAETTKNRRRPVFAVVLVGLVATVIIGSRDLQHIAANNRATTAAAQGDWQTAQLAFTEAVQLAPELPFYQRQAAIAAGMVAETQPQYREPAIEAYRAALEKSPPFDRLPIDAANLACLLWENGQQAEAIEQMATAVKVLPNSTLFRLNMGLYLEQAGNIAAAHAEYARLLALKPDFVTSAFWTETAARQTALPEIIEQADALLREDLPDSAGQLIDLHLAAGHVQAARQLYAAWPATSTKSVAAHLAVGKIYLAEKQFDAARTEFQLARQLEPAGHEALFYLSRVALAQGQIDVAGQAINAALYLTAPPHYLHQAGRVAAAAGDIDTAPAYFDDAFYKYTVAPKNLSGRYATEVARRRPLPENTLPCLTRLYPTAQLLDLTVKEADLLRDQGNYKAAALIYRRFLAVEPGVVDIQTELEALCREHLEACKN